MPSAASTLLFHPIGAIYLGFALQALHVHSFLSLFAGSSTKRMQRDGYSMREVIAKGMHDFFSDPNANNATESSTFFDFVNEERLRRQKLDDQIDAFLRGEVHELNVDSDAPKPNVMLSPSDVVRLSLHELRKFDESDPSHAAVFNRFLAPLSRSERWGMSHQKDPWKQVIRGALTPIMLARRIRSSPLSVLLDWETLSTTDGFAVPQSRTELSTGNSVAFVNAALFFGDGVEPSIIQFRLCKLSGLWLIDDATINRQNYSID